MIRTILLTSALLCTPILPLAGCASSGSPAKLASTTGTMGDIEALLDDGENELNQLINSMNALPRASNTKDAYRAFDDNIEDIEEIAERVRARRITLQTRASEYVAQWRAESAGLSSDRAVEISQERRDQFEQSVDAVSEELDQLRAEYDPFISRLRDLRVVLSNDLTSRGIDMTEPIREEVVQMARKLRSQSADARDALQNARDEFARPASMTGASADAS